jgi:hypothetical protein
LTEEIQEQSESRIHPDFKTYEDVFEGLGYRHPKRNVGLGVTGVRQNSKNIILSINQLGHRSINWLQRQLDSRLGIKRDYSSNKYRKNR